MLDEDVTRIKDSFEQIDTDVNDLYGTTTQFSQDAQSGGYWFGSSTSVNSIVRGVTIYSNNSSQNPSVSQYG